MLQFCVDITPAEISTFPERVGFLCFFFHLTNLRFCQKVSTESCLNQLSIGPQELDSFRDHIPKGESAWVCTYVLNEQQLHPLTIAECIRTQLFSTLVLCHW